MAPEDEAALERFHRGLSPETTRLRFFATHPRLSDDERYRVTHVDHHDREAFVAYDGDRIIAVGRFDRLANGTDAEIAFVVADAWQGRGLGRLLLRELVARAGEVGITRFVAQTLPENHRMMSVFRHARLPIEVAFRDGVLHVVLDLDRPSAPPRPG
jgi:RimJ/RimL family protein N-acetyltransferase